MVAGPARGRGGQLPVRPRRALVRLGPADPATEPAAVAPPEGLKLPATGAARRWPAQPPAVAGDPARVAAAVQPLLRQAGARPARRRPGHRPDHRAAACSGPVPRRSPPPRPPSCSPRRPRWSRSGPMARFQTTVRYVPAHPAARARRRRRPVPGQLAPQGRGQLPRPRRRRDAGPADGRAKLRAMKVDAGPARASTTPTSPARRSTRPGPAPTSPRASYPRSARCGSTRATTPTASASSATRPPGAAQTVPRRPRGRRREGRSAGDAGCRRPPTATEVASVSSAPLGEIVERTLEVSDNQAAEVLARHVGLAERQEGSFAAGAALGARGAAAARRTRHRGPAVRRQRALAPEPAHHRLARRRGRARRQRGPPRAAPGAHRPARGRVHRLAVLPLRQGTRRRPGPGAREDRDRSPGCTASPAWPTTRAVPGWPSSWSPTGSGR